MSDMAIGLLVFLAFCAFILIAIVAVIFQWAFRVKEQIFYLRQIYDQLVHLNNANAAARAEEAQNNQ